MTGKKKMAEGIFYGIGIGPGDPELITIKGLRILQRTQIIAYPISCRGERSMALSIVEKAIDLAGKETIELFFPMRYEPEMLWLSWEEAIKRIITHLGQGEDVAFITIGDVSLYSTFIYLCEIMQRKYPHIQVRFVPGVSSLSASAAAVSLPIGKADERVAIFPATEDRDRLRKTLEDFDTVVLLKVNRVFAQVYEMLEEMGMLNKAILFQRIGTEQERIIHDLSPLTGREVDYMSLLIVKR
ncbi:MAG: precorrin-2 C(20)-methyltransferase [bacterium]